jgi:hypothetical protein
MADPFLAAEYSIRAIICRWGTIEWQEIQLADDIEVVNRGTPETSCSRRKPIPFTARSLDRTGGQWSQERNFAEAIQNLQREISGLVRPYVQDGPTKRRGGGSFRAYMGSVIGGCDRGATRHCAARVEPRLLLGRNASIRQPKAVLHQCADRRLLPCDCESSFIGLRRCRRFGEAGAIGCLPAQRADRGAVRTGLVGTEEPPYRGGVVKIGRQGEKLSFQLLVDILSLSHSSQIKKPWLAPFF